MKVLPALPGSGGAYLGFLTIAKGLYFNRSVSVAQASGTFIACNVVCNCRAHPSFVAQILHVSILVLSSLPIVTRVSTAHGYNPFLNRSNV